MAQILIVDNASFMRACLTYIVENAGHSVIGQARDGNEAVALYEKLKPQLVTMDILMEGTDGLEALRRIRAADPSARVVMISALGQEKTMEEAQSLGAAGFIRKPFKPEQVIEEITRVLGPPGAGG